MSQPSKRASVAKSSVNLLKKLVLENYQEPAREQRASARQSVVGEVEVTLLDEAGQPAGQSRVFVRDTSADGCSLWSRVEMPVGRTVMIQGRSGSGQGMSQRMGTVRHCRGAPGTGFAIGVQYATEADGAGKAA